jgi:hypothetical protein
VERFEIEARWDQPTRIQIWGRELTPGEPVETCTVEWIPKEVVLQPN